MTQKTGMPLYESMRSQIQTGDLLEWRSNSVLGRMIRHFTGEDVNHTGAAIRLGYTPSLAQRRFTLEATPHGFMVNLLSRALKGYDGEVYLLKLEWPAEEEFDRRNHFVAHLWTYLGIKYDYGSLLRSAAGAVNADMRRLFCSEAIDIALRMADMLPFSGPVRRPGGFDDITKERLRIY